MHCIENDLKTALRRKPAPPGFTAKVLKRIEDNKFDQRAPRRSMPHKLWALAAAALILVVVGTGVFQYQQRIRNRNEAALQRTLTALSIAAVQLDRAEREAFDPIQWERLSRQLTGLQMIDIE